MNEDWWQMFGDSPEADERISRFIERQRIYTRKWHRQQKRYHRRYWWKRRRTEAVVVICACALAVGLAWAAASALSPS